MKITKLTSKEFENFAKKNEYVTFHQKESWGKLKEQNGWKYELIGMKDDKKVVAATLLLEKDLPLGLKMFYAPRGFLIDFHNTELLDEFVKEITNIEESANSKEEQVVSKEATLDKKEKKVKSISLKPSRLLKDREKGMDFNL